jgi:hypothetical protein
MDDLHNHLDRAQRYHEAIRLILLHEWDPIGVSQVPEAQDEYDSYIHEIYGMLIRQESRANLIHHLWWIETQHMGLYGNRSRTEAIVDQLLGVPSAIERGT